MKTPLARLADRALQNPVQLALAAALILGTVYFLGRKTVTDVARGAGGIVTGNNAVTRGTVYEGAGVLGTAGATVNAALPFLDDVGGWIGRTVYDLTHADYDPNAKPSTTRPADEQTWWSNLREGIGL